MISLVRRSETRVAPLLLLLLFGLTGCPRNPATGERQLILVSEAQEIRMGRQGAAQVDATLGRYEEGEIAAHVEETGVEMARDTERPDLPWSVAIADDPTVNAFALPGGFLYLTRGILAHFNSEAEMAAVTGHEIGHVTARHSVEQMSRQQLAGAGLLLGSLFSQEVAQFSDLAGLGLGILFLKYSRSDERQADRLGVRYMFEQEYDPREAVKVFEMLGRLSEGSGGGGVPTWLSTHPTHEDRIEEIREQVDTLPEARLAESRVGRESYLRRLDGLVYGPDPRHGYFRGDTFLHPGREFRLEFPGGWERDRLPLVTSAQGPQRDAVVRVSVGDTTPMREAARRFFESDNVERLAERETTIHGFSAVEGEFRARAGEVTLRGLVAFVDGGDRTYHLLGFAPDGSFRRHERTFRRFVGSIERLRDPEVLAVEPMRIRLVAPERRTTIAEMAAERESPLSAERLALLNGITADEAVPAGRTIKWVVGSLPPEMR